MCCSVTNLDIMCIKHDILIPHHTRLYFLEVRAKVRVDQRLI